MQAVSHRFKLLEKRSMLSTGNNVNSYRFSYSFRVGKPFQELNSNDCTYFRWVVALAYIRIYQ